jgi:hypothetical protein
MSRFLVPAPLAALLAATAVACSDAPAGPGVGGVQLSQDLTLDQLGSALDSGASRVEIKLIPGTLIAREVEVEGDDEADERESIRARVTAVSAGSLTLEIGGLVVGFDGATRFRDDEGDLTEDDFVAAIEAVLAAGQQPFVRARRPAPAEAQAPDDDTFLATEIRIRDEADEPKIEMLVDGDNLQIADAPPPDAILTVLGLAIEIRVSTGETEIEGDVNDDDESEFEGMVAAVDVAGGSVTLTDGTVVLVVAETQVEQSDDDEDDETLGSLEAVAAALTAGLPVEAEGEGTVQGTAPLTIVAREIEFEVEDDDGDDDPAQGTEFEASVTAVDVQAGLVTLAGGVVVTLTDATVIDAEGDLLTLQAAADAVAAGQPVRAEGRGAAQAGGFVAAIIKFEVDD